MVLPSKLAFSFLILLFVTFASCEKPITSDGDADTDSGVSQNDNLVVWIPVDGVSSSRLNFAVYDMSGNRVKQVNQQSSDANFGLASFQLAQGDYLLVVVAHSSDGNPAMANPRKIQFTNAQGFTDTFLYSGNVTIGEERKELYVAPRRIVSLCRFIMTDDYPADVAKMRFYYTGGSGAFDATTGLGCVNSKQSVLFEVADGRKAFDLYTFLHATEGTIHLKVTAYDAGDNVLYEREFDVPMKQNSITLMTGSYFTGSVSVSSVTINTGWDDEYHLTF